MKTREPNDKTKAQLRAAIIKARKAAGLSVNRAAQNKPCPVSQPSWSRIEAGELRPRYETLFGMAQAVGLAVTITF